MHKHHRRMKKSALCKTQKIKMWMWFRQRSSFSPLRTDAEDSAGSIPEKSTEESGDSNRNSRCLLWAPQAGPDSKSEFKPFS
mmetsp:Transcript_100578/g.158565  ORF Transcript_100578/g.158565 Transcript_100578/m.158565 type:complete len:82 (-) Transcript_100578:30-275(-)